MKKYIKIECQNCERVHKVYRTEEIPREVKSLKCNFCPSCQDEMTDNYKEEYVYGEEGEYKKPDKERFRALFEKHQKNHRVKVKGEAWHESDEEKDIAEM